MQSWRSTSRRPMPMMSNPRFTVPAQPDQKYPMPGVFFPDLLM